MIKYNEKTYKHVSGAGKGMISIGIVSIVTGIILGVVGIILGGILLSERKNLID